MFKNFTSATKTNFKNTNLQNNDANTLSIYQKIVEELQSEEIRLELTRKRVKNINFRLKPNLLSVSAPHHASNKDIILALSKRIDWAIHQHAIILKRIRIAPDKPKLMGKGEVLLWGAKQPFKMGENEHIEYYRQHLQEVMPQLFAKWQPIVGKTANETRIKKMKTRWGSCNTRAKRVWLSVYLPAYPIECTEYVIVHELCHLHHANHSAKFWSEVERSMPDYMHWHLMLAGKSGDVD